MQQMLQKQNTCLYALRQIYSQLFLYNKIHADNLTMKPGTGACSTRKNTEKEKCEDTLLIVQVHNVYIADHCSDYNIFLI
jgi:hypothetical protein